MNCNSYHSKSVRHAICLKEQQYAVARLQGAIARYDWLPAIGHRQWRQLFQTLALVGLISNLLDMLLDNLRDPSHERN